MNAKPQTLKKLWRYARSPLPRTNHTILAHASDYCVLQYKTCLDLGNDPLAMRAYREAFDLLRKLISVSGPIDIEWKRGKGYAL